MQPIDNSSQQIGVSKTALYIGLNYKSDRIDPQTDALASLRGGASRVWHSGQQRCVAGGSSCVANQWE